MDILNNKVYKLVLTGGPCGGKTTGQARLCTFFENMGWKVYRVPETASIILGGGVNFTEFSDNEIYNFQLNLVKTMMCIENTFFQLAQSSSSNCIVICDRGVMDTTAYMKPGQWIQMKKQMGWNDIDLRDNRYNQVIYMTSAANGAESFYGTEGHSVRQEDIELARKLDDYSSQAWVGHPYFDIICNSTNFEAKIMRIIIAVCNRLGIDAGLSVGSTKRKFVVSGFVEDMANTPYQAFTVVHDYLLTSSGNMQARIRKRGQNDNWTYTHTTKKVHAVEKRMQLKAKQYELLIAERDTSRYSIHKKRRCFLWNSNYFQMDIYQEPCHPNCKNLILLETYTSQKGELSLPDFLTIVKEVTNEPTYSMYNLSKKGNMKDEADFLLTGRRWNPGYFLGVHELQDTPIILK